MSSCKAKQVNRTVDNLDKRKMSYPLIIKKGNGWIKINETEDKKCLLAAETVSEALTFWFSDNIDDLLE